MKKIFLVVSILFLNTFIFAKDFNFFCVQDTSEKMLAYLEMMYTRIGQKESGIYYNTDRLFYKDYKIESLIFNNKNYGSDEKYSLMITFHDISTNDWTDIIFNTIYEYTLFPYKKDPNNPYWVFSLVDTLVNNEQPENLFTFTEIAGEKVILFNRY